ncbi:olfactory receptor 5T3-like [Menidia menidia]
MLKTMMVNFYTTIIKSILTLSITTWYANTTTKDKVRLQQMLHSAEEVIGCHLPSLNDPYTYSSMEAELNVTFITLDGFVQLHKFKYLYFVILFPVYILILCCNFTIVFLVVFKKSLHEPMYIFIAALLLNSALFSTVVFPKLLIDLLSERRTTVKFVMSLQVITYNPLFNPIIYGLKMKEISKQIKKLLCNYKIS